MIVHAVQTYGADRERVHATGRSSGAMMAPRMQIWHGSVDGTLAPANYQEAIKQWTNVFGLSQAPTSTLRNYPQNNCQTDNYGENVQGIFANGLGHSVPVNLTASEEGFGL
ncbi:hypothetical protein VTK26DRAFT_3292 [Humicola hyalothermophila]